MKSDSAKKGIERAPHRSLMKGIGYTDEEIRRPLIGVANSINTAIPGHVHLDKITEAVKAGIYMAGGTPVEFGTIGVCDGHCHEPCGHEILSGEPGADCGFR